MDDLKTLLELIQNGENKGVDKCTQRLLDSGVSPDEIINRAVMPALEDVGKRFNEQEIFIPEMLLATRATKTVHSVIRAAREKSGTLYSQKMVIGTVAGDMHDLGKDLVSYTVSSAGIEVINLGVDVSAERFVRAAEEDENVVVVAISALLTTTMPAMKKTVAALRASKAAGRIKIMVGGAPVTADFAKKMKADYYTVDAFQAAELVKKLVIAPQEGKL